LKNQLIGHSFLGLSDAPHPVAALPDEAALLSCSVTFLGLDVFMFAPRDKNCHRSNAA
jgi:hypothetical protein